MNETQRIFSLSDRPKHIRRLARQELSVLVAYPEDECCRRQAALLLLDEFNRWQQAQASGMQYAPSSLSYGVTTKIDKQFQQRVSCGLVALAMIALQNAKLTPSLETATDIVWEYNNTAQNSEAYLLAADGSVKTRLVALLSDKNRIKRAWRSFRSVAHCIGAQIVTGDILEPQAGFEETPDADACYYNALMIFQARMLGLPSASEWGIWRVEISPPFDPKAFPLLAPERAIEHLVEPWVRSGRSPLSLSDPISNAED